MEYREYIKSVLKPLEAIPVDVDPKLRELHGVRAVVFDIYGTLLISEAGGPDLSVAPTALHSMEEISRRMKSGDGEALLDAYREGISSRQEIRRAEGIDHPEVDIREVWKELAQRFSAKEEEVESLAIGFECGVNPVWPMPHAGRVLEELKRNGVKLGIISNAQFYTPIIMEAFFGTSLEDCGFDEGWSVFSFELLEGKPSTVLFENLREHAAADGFSAEEILYVGNDFDKDVVPAAKVGFRTCLFAGDARSLRLGGREWEVAVEIADVVVTDLEQIPRLIGRQK